MPKVKRFRVIPKCIDQMAKLDSILNGDQRRGYTKKLASIDTCSSSCMDAASGSPSATRAIITSEIIPREQDTQRFGVSALQDPSYFKKQNKTLCVSAVKLGCFRERGRTGGSSWCVAE